MEVVLAAAIAAIPATFAALGGWRSSRRTRDIVTGNGQGNVAEMGESTLLLVRAMAVQFGAHVEEDARNFSDIREHLDKIARN